MYLKQKGLKISGSKAELIDRVLTHARGNLSARDAVEDEESPNSCEDDTSSESSDTSGLIFLRSTSLLNKILPTNLGACKPTFHTFYTSHLR